MKDTTVDTKLLIANRLRTARKQSGYKSSREFALKYGIPESTYSQHETGKRKIRIATLLRYCEFLSISPGWIIVGEDHYKNSNLL